MAHSLEVREPLMDHPLVEWVARLPQALKIGDGESKLMLKRASEPWLPKDVLYRPKMGFAVPLAEWFRGPLRGRIAETLRGDRLRESGFFDPGRLSVMLEEHQAGSRDWSASLWALQCFDGFLQRCSEGAPSPAKSDLVEPIDIG